VVLSLDTQIAEMQAHWPQLRLAAREGQVAVWRGPLRPLFQTFQIDVHYRAPLLVEARLSARVLQPRVRVLSPPLRWRRNDKEGPLPHVYYDAEAGPWLCMLDPDAGDWSAADSLAETTVPWTIEWLAAYEGWRTTGQWTASGRHSERA